MTTTELTENLKSIINEYDRTFAEQMAALPKEAKTERRALHIQRGMCNIVQMAGILACNRKGADIHHIRLKRMLSQDSNDYRVYHSLTDEERDLSAVYLDTILYMETEYLSRIRNELALAREHSDEDSAFGLEIQCKTIEMLLSAIRAWWTENGCAEFEA